MKIVTIVGARPQFIKAATVSRAFQKHNIEEIIVHTGQHFDANMSQVFFDEMEIPKPVYNLEVGGLNHGAMTGRMLEKIEEVLIHEKPNWLLVYGDTNSTLAGALAASKLQINIAHVEAGLRSFDIKMPEEINRILTDRISTILFCPTLTAIHNLEKEGFRNFNCQLELVGDVMYDAAMYYEQKALAKSTILKTHQLVSNEFILCTIHRAENTNDLVRLKSICQALNKINKKIPIVLPLHPRTRQSLKKANIDLEITFIDPLGYFDTLMLLKNCRLVITDSGGLQKEAFFFRKFCLTLRDQTEWVELVNVGANLLAGCDDQKIIQGYKSLMSKEFNISNLLYGNGQAADLITQKLLYYSSLSI